MVPRELKSRRGFIEKNVTDRREQGEVGRVEGWRVEGGRVEGSWRSDRNGR